MADTRTAEEVAESTQRHLAAADRNMRITRWVRAANGVLLVIMLVVLAVRFF